MLVKINKLEKMYKDAVIVASKSEEKLTSIVDSAKETLQSIVDRNESLSHDLDKLEKHIQEMTANIESQHKILESGKKALENGVELAIYSNLPQEIKDLTWVEEGLTCIYQRWFRSITLAVCDRNRVLKLLEYAHIAPTINEFISDDDNDVYTVKIC